METTNVTHRGIVQEVLTKDNYERWKTLMRNYLQGKNLWAIVENDFDSTFEDRRMSAEALHIIQLSCGSKILDEISHFKTARDAWNHLGARYGFELKATPDIEQGLLDDSVGEYRDLYRYVERGDWTMAESFMRNRRDAIFAASASGRTVLHVATMAGHAKIVEGLVRVGRERLAEMQDEKGYTALALAARLTGNINVAKCMVEEEGGRVRHNLLAIKNEDDEIALLVAAAAGDKDMTRYLYSLTSLTLLDGQDSRGRVLLLQRCIKAEIFDVALGLLEYYPQLLTESLSDGFRALHELVEMPSAFLSGCHYGVAKKFIYDILRLERRFQVNNLLASTANVPGFSGRFSERLKAFQQGFLTRIATNLQTGGFHILLLPTKLLVGPVLLEIAYVFVQFFKFLNILGIRELYEQKCAHYQVLQILSYLQRSVEVFNDSQLQQASVHDAMLHAAKHGLVEFINAMTKANPDLLWSLDSHKRGVFSYAVLHRKKNVFQLIYTLNGRKDIIESRKDVFGNNLLHLAGHLGPSSYLNQRPGAALQMQREIQWFKAVEKVVDPKCKEAKNDDNKKPHELFSETHEELVKAGEKWAKEIANSFALVGVLITTVMFAAAFTVPGGNNQDTGVPIFLNNKLFTTFLVADAVSLFTSSSSVLIFIGIMTSRYAEKDFPKSLPWKLLFGLFFLFLSIVSMMVAFCAALGIVLKKYWAYKQFLTGAIIMGSVPVIILVPSQLRLMYHILRSTLSNPIG